LAPLRSKMSRMESSNDLPQLAEIPEQEGGVLRKTMQMNTLLPSDRSQFTKKLPKKCISFQTSFRSSSGSFLPEFAESNHFPSKSLHKPMTFRASQKGRGDILPTSSPPKSTGYASDQGWNVQPMTFRASEKGRNDILPTTTSVRADGYTSDQSKTRNQPKSLRRRTASTNWLSSDDSSHPRSGEKSPSDHYYIPGKSPNNVFRKLGSDLWRFVTNADWTHITIFCCLVYLLYDSYVKLVTTSGQLQKLKDDEGLMLLHLHRLEQQSIRVHENMAKIGDKTNKIDESLLQKAQNLFGSSDGDSNLNSVPTGSIIDDAEIRAQTQQLYEMEQELDHELHSLQAKLQQAARTSITSKYGDGPIKVVLEIEIPDETDISSNKISIILWYDTPHASWAWLKQILIGEWDGSEFQVAGDLSSIDAQPIIYNAGKLDFLEKSQKAHELWTVGLSNNEGNLGMFINLKDNTEYPDRQYTVCVGKVIDGFDVVKRILRSAHKNKGTRPIRIHTARASPLHRDGTESNQ
jgi:hypothetical protein